VYVAEGEKDCEALWGIGAVAVCNAMGAGKADKFDWSPLAGKHVIIVADKDDPGRKHVAQVVELVAGAAASVRVVEAAVGKDAADHIAAGRGLDEFVVVDEPKPATQVVPLVYLHERYRYWLGEHYDLDAIDSALCVAAVEKLDGDPLWLLVVSGSGMAKSETVVPIASCPGAVMVSTIASEGALLSMSSAKDRVKSATGGLLRELGGRGLMVIKDFTTILSMPGDRRPSTRSQGSLRQ
jgi:Toprim domain